MDLKRFFNPRAVAVVGVSEHPKKVGHLVARNMLAQGYAGELYFVHPSGDTILGKKTYKSLKAIGQPIDLVILAVPAKIAVSYLDEIHAIACRHVVMFAAGFGETHTPDGDALEKQLQEKINAYGLTLLGPNCIGCIHTGSGLNATFFNSIPKKGSISIISQSGALGSAILDYMDAKTYLGISHFISLGNKSQLTESDCLEYLMKDSATKVIGMYLEDVVSGPRFSRLLSEVARKKPVVILKSGRSKEGSQAAMSHTGSMVQNDEVFSSVITQAGAIRAESFAEFQMLLTLFDYDAVPKNRRILVLSNAGGMGVLLTDEIVSCGLSLVTVSEKTSKKLSKAFEDTKKITVHNPIDLLGDASAFDYDKAIHLTLKEKDIGAVVVLLTPQANTEIMDTARVLEKVYHTFKLKPLYPIFMGKKSVAEAHSFFESHKIASFRYFASLPTVLSKILTASDMRTVPKKEPSILPLRARLTTQKRDIETILSENMGKPFLNQYDSLSVIGATGIPISKMYHATSYEDMARIAKKEGFPLVAKIASDKVTHKTEVKGVITGILTLEDLHLAYHALEKAGGAGSGCFVQKQESGYEFIVGATRDPTFGVVVMVGLGGIYAELLKEVVRLVYPFTYHQFAEMFTQSKLEKLLHPFRGNPPVDVRKVFETAWRLGLLMEHFPQIREIDINPLMVSGDLQKAVDARIIL